MIMMGILLFLEFTGGVCIIIWGMEESPVLARELHEVFIHLIHVMDYDFQAQKVHKQIMEYVSGKLIVFSALLGATLCRIIEILLMLLLILSLQFLFLMLVCLPEY